MPTTPTPADRPVDQLRAAAVRARETGDPLHTALATWLDTEAATWAGDEVHNSCSTQSCTFDAALAVARQPLGTSAAGGVSYRCDDCGALFVPGSDVELTHDCDDHRAAPPAPADRAAVLREAADHIDHLRATMGAPTVADCFANGLGHAAADLRRLAADAAAGVQPPTTDENRTALRGRIATALITAAYRCDGDCGLSERACYDAHPITWSAMAGGTTHVDGSVTDIADVVLTVLADDVRPSDIQVWPLTRVLTDVRCGSQDWTWDEEWADLDRRHAETGYLDRLEQEIKTRGITMPVLIGSDGRLWDGHHRLRIAVRLGIGYVPVEITPPAAPARTRAPEEAAR